MKKLYYIITLMFITLLASCSQEEMVDKEKEDNRVNISAELPADIVVTRAPITVPATHQLRCIIEVWTQNANPVLEYRQETIVENGAVPAFDFALLPGDYDCLMWADFVKKDAAVTDVTTGSDVAYKHFEDFCYDTSDLNNVSIKDEQGTTLFDTGLCEGFFANLELKKSLQPVSRVVKLARPFSQLVLKEKDSDKFATLKSLRVSYEMPKGFNVATGEPTSDMMAAVYSKNFQSGDNSQVLFAGYLFTPSAGFTLGTTTLALTTTGKTTNEIPSGTINLVRNQRMTASGNLVIGGGVEPDPEPGPGRDPLVGDYFFKNGTWGSELTDENKDDCIGLVYAIGPQTGDDIANYPDSEGKSIKGYVLSLKALTPVFEATADHGYIPGSKMYPRLFLYNKQHKIAYPAGENDRKNHNGYVKTQELLSSNLFKAHSSDLYYPALQCFDMWMKDASTVNPTNNASEWYIPSARQVLAAVGACYGTEKVDGIEAMEKNEALSAALKKVVEAKIGLDIGGGSGYYIFNSSLNQNELPEPVAVQVKADGTLVAAKLNRKDIAGYLRPVLTIIK